MDAFGENAYKRVIPNTGIREDVDAVQNSNLFHTHEIAAETKTMTLTNSMEEEGSNLDLKISNNLSIVWDQDLREQV